MGAGGELPLTFRCLTANPIDLGGGGRGGSQGKGIALPKNWDQSLFQEDTGANMIML